MLEPDVFELEKLKGVSEIDEVCSVDLLDLLLLDIDDVGSGVLESIGFPGKELNVEFKILEDYPNHIRGLLKLLAYCYYFNNDILMIIK